MEPEVYNIMRTREDDFWWHRGMKRIITALMKKYAGNTSLKILDAGCGTGGMFGTLKRFGEVYGVDTSSEAVEYARGRGIAKEVTRADVQRIPYADGFFDAVGCFDILYHRLVESPEQAVLEMRRVLKPGGLLIIREPAYNWLRSAHDLMVWTERRFTRVELQRLLEQAGFDIVKSSYTNSLLFPIALVKRLLERLQLAPGQLHEEVFKKIAILDSFFYFCLRFESVLVPFINFPFGLSIICLARKRT